MKASKSSLETVRTLRERQEQQALQEYGKSLRVLEQARNSLEVVEQELAASWVEFQKQLARKAKAEELTRIQDYCQRLATRKGECGVDLEVARRQARLAFIKLLAAQRIPAVIEKLQEAQKQRYLEERRRYEHKTLDDLASRRNAVSGLRPPAGEPMWN